MNFKKFISGVSALTIAASAFAGLAVTASADNGNTTLNVTADTYVYNANDYKTTNYGSAEAVQVNSAENQLTHSTSPGLKNPTKVGLFKFDYSAYKDYTITKATLYFYAKNQDNTNGSTMNFCRLTDDTWTESAVTYSSQGWTYRGTGTQFVTPNVNVYITNKTTSFTKFSVDVSSMFGSAADSDGTLSLAAYCGSGREQSIASKETTETDVSGAYIDIEYSTTAISADSLTISYKNGNSQVASDEYDLSDEGLYVGNTYSYTMPAYVTDDSNNLYKVNVSSYTATASLTSADTTVNVSCTPLGTTGAFYDTNDKTYGSDGTQMTAGALSGNKAVRHISGSGSSKAISVNAPGAGIYTVTVCGCTNNANRTEYLYVYKNSDSDDNLLDTISGLQSYNYPKTQSVDVVLEAGDKIIVKASGDNAGVDYVLLKLNNTTAATPDVAMTDITENGNDAASYGTFTVNGSAVSKVVATVTLTNETKKSIIEALGTTVTGTCLFAIVVNKNISDISNVSVAVY